MLLETVLNELLIAAPRAIAPAITAIAIKLIRRAYSIADAPRSALSFEMTFAAILFMKTLPFLLARAFR